MKYDLFITDYDGTLGDAKEIIDDETLSAIREYVNKGGHFAVCTGRPFQSIKRILGKYDIDGIVGCLQGAEVKDLKTGNTLHKKTIDDKTALGIISEMKKDGLSPNMFTSSFLYYENISEYVNVYINMKSIDCVRIESLEDFILNNPNEILKIVANCSDSEIEFYREKYNKLFGKTALFNSGAKRLFETVNKDSTKGKNVEVMAKYYNVPTNKVITVGDSTNDLDLVVGKWYGVAVKDGSEELKNNAKEITVEFEKKPVKTLLRKYCL